MTSKKFIYELRNIINWFNSPTDRDLTKFEIKFKKDKFSLYIEYSEVLHNSVMTKFIGSNELIDFKLFKNYVKLIFSIANDDVIGKNIDVYMKELLSEFKNNGNSLERLTITNYLVNHANLKITMIPNYSDRTSISIESPLTDWNSIIYWLDNVITRG